jgi:hypothetical protein
MLSDDDFAQIGAEKHQKEEEEKCKSSEAPKKEEEAPATQSSGSTEEPRPSSILDQPAAGCPRLLAAMTDQLRLLPAMRFLGVLLHCSASLRARIDDDFQSCLGQFTLLYAYDIMATLVFTRRGEVYLLSLPRMGNLLMHHGPPLLGVMVVSIMGIQDNQDTIEVCRAFLYETIVVAASALHVVNERSFLVYRLCVVLVCRKIIIRHLVSLVSSPFLGGLFLGGVFLDMINVGKGVAFVVSRLLNRRRMTVPKYVYWGYIFFWIAYYGRERGLWTV